MQRSPHCPQSHFRLPQLEQQAWQMVQQEVPLALGYQTGQQKAKALA
jgi:hypothetical protein